MYIIIRTYVNNKHKAVHVVKDPLIKNYNERVSSDGYSETIGYDGFMFNQETNAFDTTRSSGELTSMFLQMVGWENNIIEMDLFTTVEETNDLEYITDIFKTYKAAGKDPTYLKSEEYTKSDKEITFYDFLQNITEYQSRYHDEYVKGVLDRL